MLIFHSFCFYRLCQKDPLPKPDPVIITLPIKFEITWNSIADLPSERGWLPPTACVLNDKIYVIGGTGTNEVSAGVEVYDPATDTWEVKQSLNVARWGHSAEVVNGKIYVMGGCAEGIGPGLTSIEEYNPADNTWTEIGHMSFGRIGFGSCVIGSKIYVVGGCGEEPTINVYGDVDVYDVESKSWSRLQSMPEERAYLSVSTLNNKIYAIGGS